MGKRKVCVVTGSRAEYGLLYWLMREINSEQSLALKLIVSGSHLETNFGDTYKTIEDDGFKIDASIQLKLKDDSPLGVSRSLALAVKGFAEALGTINPDIVVILGDRFEVLGAAEAAMIAGFPIAHIHGGEVTEGAFDDSIRHAITKMAHLHFASTESYRDRIIQMGEAPDRVFVVGAPGLDNILNLDLMDLKSLSTSVGIDLNRDYFLKLIGTGRYVNGFAIFVFIAHTDFDGVETIQYVELGQADGVDGVNTDSVFHQHGIEPATST